ncbi:U3 small nucleolar ribonucleoprotein protein MPP10 [Drosophila grimshawi]|uniref:U3 small nucleolar ribonucleoprotein protein MPP10 n=1 Tax=Drosophila grimshawi TaxID=7222 RepID=B4JBC1_DROGR|nr:U3 small nucleolar ribonucleoprotein protein MPP10 [Drosophila grimshawi]EDW02926.1 GH10769 [Drosophila grimshawi]
MGGNNRNKTKTNVFKEIADNFEQLTTEPERFLKPQPESIESIHQLIQQTYGVSINSSSSDVATKNAVLPELVLEDMDEEQIWQQLEMRNDLVLKQFLEQSAQLIAMREQNLGIELDDDDDDDEDDDEHANGEASEPESDGESAEEEHQSETEDFDLKPSKSKKIMTKSGKRGRSSVVDDKFFKLDEMKQFLEQEDAKEMRKQKTTKPIDDPEAIDYFTEDFGLADDSDESDEEGGDNANYADFFDMDDELQKEATKMQELNGQKDFFNESDSEQDENEKDAEESAAEGEGQPEEMANEIDEANFVAQSGMEPASDSDSANENSDDEDKAEQQSAEVVQSTNEMREARLFQRIRDYEDVVLGEKPWQLKGEVQAGSRPQNSLLEEILEFDSTTRPSNPITEEQNQTIEDIIMQRIRDKAWDDVERKVRPVHTPQEYRKQLVLDQEKSKLSLAQIYEQQFQKELDNLNPNRDDDDSTAPEPKEHQDIKRDMRQLFLKLDALSNFHFTPKPVAPEAKIVTNTPAINMEEVAPLAVSDAKLLAPEEVFRGPKHTPLGKTERTSTDKNRERRKKKQKQRAINNVMEKREVERAKQGKAPSQRESNAKLLKTITKSRNVHKITSSNDQSALKSSRAFFNKLQDTTTSSTIATGSKRPKKDPSRANAKKLKL